MPVDTHAQITHRVEKSLVTQLQPSAVECQEGKSCNSQMEHCDHGMKHLTL